MENTRIFWDPLFYSIQDCEREISQQWDDKN